MTESLITVALIVGEPVPPGNSIASLSCRFG
jgi:hypothetical protein